MLADPYPELRENLSREAPPPDRGLTEEEVRARREVYGRNVLEEEKTSRLGMFLRQFQSFLVYILLLASAVSLLIGDSRDFWVIAGILVLNAVLGFWQEVKAEASIRALKEMTERHTRVVRDGAVVDIPSSDLVPDDIVLLADGDVITADVRLLDSAGLMIDESPITGESIPVSKDHTVEPAPDTPVYDLVNRALAGTTVVRGSGKGIVTGTGKATYLATIAGRVTEKSPDTPLTRAIRAFSRRYIILIVLLLAVVGTVNYLSGGSPSQIAYVLVAQLVSSVPEGLPLVVTLVMIVGATALSRKKTLTRYLPAVETLGSATVLASDKTGTITEGRPEVKDTFPSGEGRLRMVAALCNDSRDGYGDPIDVSLARWVGGEFQALRQRYPLRGNYPFDTARKFMATVNDVDGSPTVFIKGAFESLKPLTANPDTEALEEALNSMAEAGLRVLALGSGPFTDENPDNWKIEIIGLVGFLDPPKEGVREAVLTAQSAGIRVMMITGDYPATARRIAEDVGIFRPGDRTLTGSEVEGMDDEELGAALPGVTVLARILPEHKYRVVRVLQEQGDIVAVTGDGVNDVPALRVADLGIAMGAGTEAAKSVAKMIILDNNLKVIVDAIRNGRVIARNLRKVIYYLVSTSLGELTLISTTILMGMPLPLLPIQILWINLVTDGVQDKTFAFAREEGNVMDHPPPRMYRGSFSTARRFSGFCISG